MRTLFTALLGLTSLNCLGVQAKEAKEGPKRVAIIGAGAGGSSAAYYLRKFAASQEVPVDITVYEKNSYVGGRVTTVNAYDDPEHPVELGASIFVAVNKILVNATKDLGLSLVDSGSEDGVVGVYDGNSFVLEMPSNPLWNAIKLVWKYGLAPLRTQQLMKSTVGNFLKLYQAPHFPFNSLTEAATNVDLLQATGHTGEQFLEEHGLYGQFAESFVQSSTRVNYGQNLGLIHGLETMVCMAAEGGIMQIKGGNWRIFQGMLEASKAKIHLNTSAVKLEKTPKGTWIVHTSPEPNASLSKESKDIPPVVHTAEFDSVILASPYQFSSLEISPALKKTPDEIPYATLHVTLFASPHKLSPKFFGLPENQEVPGFILTTLNSTEQHDKTIKRGKGVHGVGNVGFFSISIVSAIQRPLDGVPNTFTTEYVYKVFSPAEFSNARILAIIGAEKSHTENPAITWIHRKIWQAYPYLYPRVTFEDIVLDGKRGSLFYTSGVESFISTMETSGLMGMNVAQLVVNSWAKKGKREEEEKRGGSEQIAFNQEL